MAGKNRATIRDREKKCFGKVKASVHAHSEPQRASAFERKRENHADNKDGASPHQILASIPQMNRTKQERKQNGRRPEADAVGQGVLRVSSKREFFKEPHENKKRAQKTPQRSATAP